MRILAIETSCDETAAAVVEDGVKILSNIIASSAAMHEKYGGIVPEVAARKQLESIQPVIHEALDQAKTHYQYIDVLAVTVGPGLIGSLLVGVETAKTIAFVTGKPIIPVNHVLAHMYANFVNSGSGLRKPQGQTPQFPAISLVVSGGHTELYLMRSIKDLTWLGGTLDDAAGECFDKSARLLGFGSGGGPAIAAAAAKSTNDKSTNLQIKLPRPMMDDNSLNFSFSGLKTAVMREWKKHQTSNSHTSDVKDSHTSEVKSVFAYEVQEAITDVLVEKTLHAAKQYRVKSILLSGGVAANTKLREKFLSKLEALNSKLSFHAPPVALCTDNAVSIASYAYFRGKAEGWHGLTAFPDLSVEI